MKPELEQGRCVREARSLTGDREFVQVALVAFSHRMAIEKFYQSLEDLFSSQQIAQQLRLVGLAEGERKESSQIEECRWANLCGLTFELTGILRRAGFGRE